MMIYNNDFITFRLVLVDFTMMRKKLVRLLESSSKRLSR